MWGKTGHSGSIYNKDKECVLESSESDLYHPVGVTEVSVRQSLSKWRGYWGGLGYDFPLSNFPFSYVVVWEYRVSVLGPLWGLQEF